MRYSIMSCDLPGMWTGSPKPLTSMFKAVPMAQHLYGVVFEYFLGYLIIFCTSIVLKQLALTYPGNPRSCKYSREDSNDAELFFRKPRAL